jgi:hypothetical protein
MAEESKTELKEKLDRALATNTRERRKRENLEQDLVDTAFTIGGGLAAGVIAREFGPLGESSYDIPINLASGVLLALIGLAEWGGSISSELASFGIGQLTFHLSPPALSAGPPFSWGIRMRQAWRSLVVREHPGGWGQICS